MTLLQNWKLPFATCLMLSSLLVAAPTARAQAASSQPAGVGEAFALSASTAGGANFETASLRGNVAVVFYWSTGCAVCRDSLPEFRANLVGWRNKAFSLVVVNVDRQVQDWLAYEGLVGKMQAPLRGYVSVRKFDAAASPTRLPLTLVVDAKGKVVQRIEGRVAPEVWDTVADLLN